MCSGQAKPSITQKGKKDGPTVGKLQLVGR